MTSRPTIHVTEHLGDLLEVSADVLVNPWNRNFIPRPLLWPYGVSGALKKKTGPEPWRDLARMGMLELGAAVVAGPGRMVGPTHLIHVAGLTTWWKATPAGVAACARNAVALALELPATSLAMPLIGAGTGGLTEDASRQAIAEGLKTFDQAPHETADLQVTIVSFRK